MPRLRFILNPNSGKNLRRPWLAAHLREWITAQRLDADLHLTSEAGHGTALATAAAAAGCERVVAVGGDGTMNEVARALVQTPTALALVPSGSGDGLGRHLGVHGTLEHALHIAHTGRVREIDTGTANGLPFFNAMGVGFDAEIARRFNALTSRGLRNYVRTGLGTFFRYRPQRYFIEVGGASHPIDAFIVAVANSDQYGNNARIAPGAQVDDGAMDLVAVQARSWLGASTLVWRLFTGSLTRSRKVIHHRAAAFTIRREAEGPLHVDGETRTAGTVVEVRVLPRSLRFVVPR